MTDGITTVGYLTTVSFGFGASALLSEALAEAGIGRPLVVTDSGVRAAGIADGVVRDVDVTWFDQSPANPTEAAVLEAIDAFRAGGCDGVVMIGGGSSIDPASAGSSDDGRGGFRTCDLSRVNAAPVLSLPYRAGWLSGVGS